MSDDFHTPKPRFRLSPELTDGEHWTIDSKTDSVVEAVRTWCNEFLRPGSVGEQCTIEIVMMSDADIAALPEL